VRGRSPAPLEQAAVLVQAASGADTAAIDATELNARPRKTLGGITPAQAMQRLLFDPERPIVATTA
jgi:hypothetical protein